MSEISDLEKCAHSSKLQLKTHIRTLSALTYAVTYCDICFVDK